MRLVSCEWTKRSIRHAKHVEPNLKANTTSHCIYYSRTACFTLYYMHQQLEKANVPRTRGTSVTPRVILCTRFKRTLDICVQSIVASKASYIAVERSSSKSTFAVSAVIIHLGILLLCTLARLSFNHLFYPSRIMMRVLNLIVRAVRDVLDCTPSSG